MPQLSTTLKAEAIKAAFSMVTGAAPEIIYQPDNSARLIFTEDAAAKIREYLETQAAKKSDVSIDLLPIAVPLILKKTGLYIGLAAAALFFAGYFFGKN